MCSSASALVYGLSLTPHRAVCVSMAAIGATTALATLQHLRSKEKRLDLRAGLILALAGILGAPAGAWVGRFVPEKWLLVVFAGFVLLIAIRMLFGSPAMASNHAATSQPERRDEISTRSESVRASSRTRALGLCAAGLLTGMLAGLLGVGGGFILVPVLVLFAGIEIHRAIATSLCVIALVSVPATASHLLAGQTIPLDLALLFAAGCLVGMTLGSPLAAKLSVPRLQRLFGTTMLVMAVLILFHNLK